MLSRMLFLSTVCLFLQYTVVSSSYFFLFTDTPTTEIYTLSLHDALPISDLDAPAARRPPVAVKRARAVAVVGLAAEDRKSTRLNSSHRCISYAVFCLKKKKKHERTKQCPVLHSTRFPSNLLYHRQPRLPQ